MFKGLPKNFTDWVEKNGERIEASAKKGTLPYFQKSYQRTAIDHLKDDEFDSLLTEIAAEVEGIGRDISARGAVFGTPSCVRCSRRIFR